MQFIKLTGEQAASLVEDISLGKRGKQLATKYGVSYAMVWKWYRYAGLNGKWFIHVKQLERQIKLLKLDRDKSKVQMRAAIDVVKRLEPSRKRRALFASAIQVTHGLSRSRANLSMGLSAHSRAHESMRIKDEALVREMKRFIAGNPGAGFVRMFKVLLQGRGCTRHYAEQLYRQARLSLQHREPISKPPRRVIVPRLIIGQRDAVWGIDYMMCRLANGSRVDILNAVDEYTRECVFCVASRSPGIGSVISALSEAVHQGRRPAAIRTDNSKDFTSDIVTGWCWRHQIAAKLIRPGHPEENVFVERFHGTLRREVLNWYEFRSVKVLQRMLDDFRVRYNVGRPHHAHGGLSPLQFAELSAVRQREVFEQSRGLKRPARQPPKKAARARKTLS